MATEIFLLSHLDAVITYTIRYDTIRYDTKEEFNVDSKAE